MRSLAALKRRFWRTSRTPSARIALKAVPPAFPNAANYALPLRKKAEAGGSREFTPLWTGQAGPLGRAMPAGELTRRLAEEALAREARRRGAHGVVCGHIHHAELRDIGGILYANDGDWVESLTALVEHPDGRLEILDWGAQRAAGTGAAPVGSAAWQAS